MKCSICKKEISNTQVKYGDASGVRRDENNKIISRGFHHDCMDQKFNAELTPDYYDKTDSEPIVVVIPGKVTK